MTDNDYVLGHSESELRRLDLQATMIRPITRRLLLNAGLAPGMRVLDVGCGTGDVAMLAASFVGPDGFVLAVDREDVALEAAAQRAAAANLAISFRQHDFAEPADLGEFDLAIGRYVLMYQPDPSGFIRKIASSLKPGGIVAFHEIVVTDDLCRLTQAPLFRSVYDIVHTALAASTAHPLIGGHLAETFAAAGFVNTNVVGEILVYNSTDAPFYEWMALMARILLPVAERLGLTTAAEMNVETLERRLRGEAATLHSQAFFPAQITAWAAVPIK